MILESLLLPGLAFLTMAGLVLGIQSARTSRVRETQQRLAQYGPGASTASVAAAVDDLLKDRRYSKLRLLDRGLSKTGYAERVARELASAGLPLRVGEYLLIRWLIGGSLFSLIALGGGFLPLATALGAAGFFAPVLYVKHRQAKRVDKLNEQLVDALTMLANSLRSGSSFLQAIDLVAHEMPAPIGQELGQVVAEVSVGAPVEEALTSLAHRVPSYDLYLAVTAMLVQREMGGNLAEVLEGIAHMLRERFKLLRDVQVQSAQQRFSAYIIGALPLFLMGAISVMNGSYLEPLFYTQLGNVLLGVAFGMQVLGFGVMRRLTKIEV